MRLDRTGYHVEQFVGITCIAYSLLDRTDMTDRTDRQTDETSLPWGEGDQMSDVHKVVHVGYCICAP